MLTKQSVEQLIKDETGLSVVVDEPNPVFVAKAVSLASLGQIGMAVVYQDRAGALKAALIPFGAHYDAFPEAA